MLVTSYHIPGVCPEVKLGLLTDPSQNCSLQKRTLHEMFRLKNGHFTKFFLLKMDFHKFFPVKNELVINLSVQNPNICGTNDPTE